MFGFAAFFVALSSGLDETFVFFVEVEEGSNSNKDASEGDSKRSASDDEEDEEDEEFDKEDDDEDDEPPAPPGPSSVLSANECSSPPPKRSISASLE